MRLAFVADDLRHHAGAVLSRQSDGSLIAEIVGEADPSAAEAQIRRILSVDVGPAGWLAAGRADPVLGGIQQEFPGLRPVLFHPPYEAAAWAMLAQRRQRGQAAAVRCRLSEFAGVTFELAGEAESAFPGPERLLQISSFPGIDQTRLDWLHGFARAALAGQLEAADLAGMPQEEAMDRLRLIKGLGPFYAMLVYLRATGVTDALAIGEPRIASYLRHYCKLDAVPTADEVQRIAESWRPFRTWANVLIRVAGDRDGLPFEQQGRRR